MFGDYTGNKKCKLIVNLDNKCNLFKSLMISCPKTEVLPFVVFFIAFRTVVPVDIGNVKKAEFTRVAYEHGNNIFIVGWAIVMRGLYL